MLQNLTITLDVPADCTLKFDESSMKVYFEKDDTNFKKLLKEAFKVLPNIVSSIPIWYGCHTHDGYADSCFAMTKAPNRDCEFLIRLLEKRWGEKYTNEWLTLLEQSVPNWARYEKDEIYRGWDPCDEGGYLYVNREFNTIEEF